MSTSAPTPPTRGARPSVSRRADIATHRARERRRSRRAPQVAATLTGLATGFGLGALATVLGGGSGSTLFRLAVVCLALSVPALVACRRRVRLLQHHRSRARRSSAAPATAVRPTRAMTPVPPAPSAPVARPAAPLPLRVVTTIDDTVPEFVLPVAA